MIIFIYTYVCVCVCVYTLFLLYVFGCVSFCVCVCEHMYIDVGQQGEKNKKGEGGNIARSDFSSEQKAK